MNEKELELIERRYLQQILETTHQPPPPLVPRLTIPFTELPEDPSDRAGAREWNLYRREVGRLLAEGQEGKWVLIKGEEIIGIFDSQEEANQVRWHRFPVQDAIIQQIRSREPVLRGPISFRPCRS